MSSRDIDSTSENVLHDWARDETPSEGQSDEGAEQEELPVGDGPIDESSFDERPVAESPVDESPVDTPALEDAADESSESAPAWGTAPAEPEPTAAAAVETEQDLDEPAADEPEPSESEEEAVEEADVAPIRVELSQEHAAGDLHIPDGYAVLEGVSEGGRRAVGVVVSRFNGGVTTQLLDGALAELAAAGVRQDAITIMVVPGAFELPLAATALAKTRRFACIVALGCVIRGDTPHFDYVSSEAASGLQLAALETGVPVSFGVLTLDRVEQAEPRIGKGAEAVRSALEMADLFAHLRAAASR
jgi:6,7-dimethyl-8-ribityllumazine synthase